jgi:hypothetical protein
MGAFRRQQEGRTRKEFFIGRIRTAKKKENLADERASNILSSFGHCPPFYEAKN